MREKTLIALVLYLLTILLISEQTYAVIVDEHTVALWLFDEEEDRDENIISDSSGNGNNGQVTEMEWVPGKLGSGLQGNGASGYAEVPDSSLLDFTEEVSIEMWIYLNAYIPSDHFPIGLSKGSSYMFGVNSDKKLMVRIWRERKGMESCRMLSGNTDVPLQSWHHIAFTFSSSAEDLKVYLDGQEDATAWCPGTLVPNADPLWIGRMSEDFLDGIVDEVRISSITRPAEEIGTAMKGLGAFRAVRPSGKLTATWGTVKKR